MRNATSCCPWRRLSLGETLLCCLPWDILLQLLVLS